jgi:hypothetical protein
MVGGLAGHASRAQRRLTDVDRNRRVRGNRVVQRQVLYLGEINDGPRAAPAPASRL